MTDTFNVDSYEIKVLKYTRKNPDTKIVSKEGLGIEVTALMSDPTNQYIIIRRHREQPAKRGQSK